MLFKNVGFLLLMTLALTLILSVMGFFIHIEVNPFTFPLSILLTTGTFVFCSNNNYRQRAKVIFYYLVFLTISLFLSSLINDYSYDGQAYHQVTIYHLMKGWNPIYQICPSDAMQIWVNHYAKGLETISANIGSTFNNIEIGKAVSFLLTFSTYFFILHFLSLFVPDMLSQKKYIYAFIIVFSPVVFSQIYTYYIDWALYDLFLLLWVAIYDILKSSKLLFVDVLVVSIVIVFSFSFKFNFIFWVGMSILIYIFILIKQKESTMAQRSILIFSLVAFLGLIIAYNPYITNLKSGYHMLYPLVGEGKVDIMLSQTPDCFKTKPYYISVLSSLFSRPSQFEATVLLRNSQTITYSFWFLILASIIAFNRLYKSYQHIEPMVTSIVAIFSLLLSAILLYLWGGDFGVLVHTDLRIGGFGFFFPEVLFLSVVAIFVANNSHNKNIAYAIMLTLFVSLFVLPSGWWARYFAFSIYSH